MAQVDEQYRKYISEQILEDRSVFIVWGHDLSCADQPERLLSVNNRVLFFESLAQMKALLPQYSEHYFDSANFTAWVSQQDFSEADAQIDLSLLHSYDNALLTRRDDALDLLDAIHNVEDFFIQINEEKMLGLLDEQIVHDIKDYIYDMHFWAGAKPEGPPPSSDGAIFRQLYDAFIAAAFSVSAGR